MHYNHAYAEICILSSDFAGICILSSNIRLDSTIGRKEVHKLIDPQNERFGYLQILLACLVWGMYGLFVKVIPYPPEVIVFFRFLFGSLSLVIFAGLTGKMSELKLSPPWLKFLICTGLINTVCWLTLSRSIAYTSVANGYILYYTAPCFIMLLSPLILKEQIDKRSFAALGLSLIGIISIIGFSGFSKDGFSLAGNILGIISGITYALYIIALKYLPSHLLGVVSNVYVCASIALATLPLALPSIHLISFSGLLLLAACGIVTQGIGTTVYSHGLRRVKAHHASILSYFEALFATIFATIFLHEQLTPSLLLGGIIIIAGGILTISSKSENSQEVNQEI